MLLDNGKAQGDDQKVGFLCGKRRTKDFFVPQNHYLVYPTVKTVFCKLRVLVIAIMFAIWSFFSEYHTALMDEEREHTTCCYRDCLLSKLHVGIHNL